MGPRSSRRALPAPRVIEYESDNHAPWAGNREWIDHLERFVTGTVCPADRRVRARSVHITTLGRFAVTVDGAEVSASDWGSRRARQLCKRLVAARGWPVQREQLFEQLWPDETDVGKLGARLSVQLSTVRRVLGGGINATREAVALDLSEVSTDLEALFTTEDGTVAAELYGGEFLPDDPDEPWAEPVRAAARAATADLVRSTAAEFRTDERHRDAADLLRQIVAIDRYDDLAHELLVSCLLDAGDVAAARARARCARASDGRTRHRRGAVQRGLSPRLTAVAPIVLLQSACRAVGPSGSSGRRPTLRSDGSACGATCSMEAPDAVPPGTSRTC